MTDCRNSGASRDSDERQEFLRAVVAELIEQGNLAMAAADADGGRTTPSDLKYNKATAFYNAARYLDPSVESGACPAPRPRQCPTAP